MSFIYSMCFFWLLFTCPIWANEPFEEKIELTDICLGDCKIKSAALKYRLSSFFGEPVINGSFSWLPQQGTNENCLSSNVVIRIEVEQYRLQIDPIVPKGNGEFGYNVSGSPNWDTVLCTDKGECAAQVEAKDIWRRFLKIKGDVPKTKVTLAEKPPLIYDGEYRSIHSYAMSRDGKELLYHLEKMRSQRKQNIKERISWLGDEFQQTKDGCCGFDKTVRHKRLSFILSIIGELTDKIPKTPKIALECHV